MFVSSAPDRRCWLGCYSKRILPTPARWCLEITYLRASFLAASFTTRIWHLILSQGVAFGVGMGFCFVASVGVVSQWFTKKRSFANSLAASGSGFGGLCYSLASNAMIEHIGLPWTFRALAIISLIVNGICSLLIRDRNRAVGAVHLAFDLKLFRRVDFLLFLGWASFSILAYVIVVFSLPDYCQSVGLSASQGAIVGALFNRTSISRSYHLPYQKS